MKKFNIILIVIVISVLQVFATESKDSLSKRGEYTIVPFNVSITSGMSTARKKVGDGKVINYLSLNLFTGKAERLEGAEAGLIYNHYTEEMIGAQWAGIMNRVDGDARGLQHAGIVNVIGGDFFGVQEAGIINRINGSFMGIQGAGIINHVNGEFSGIQGSGIINHNFQKTTGLQGAGICNIVNGNFKGAQGSGIFNTVRGEVVGIQGASIFNQSVSVKGVQAAGIVNIAGTVEKGVQVGLVNVSDENKGVPIGLVSVVKNYRPRLDLWGDDTRFINAGIRSGSRKFHNLLFAGAQVNDGERWTLGWGFGSHFNLAKDVYTELDVVAQHINEDREKWTDEVNEVGRIRILFGYEFTKFTSIYAGPTFNGFVSKLYDGKDFTPWTLKSKYDDEENIWVRSWIGFTAGLRF